MPTELQITKPDIPVKNKASNLASQRKFRATEANKIVQAFEKADLNFAALLEAIATMELTPGDDGQNAILRTVGNMLQWKLSGADTWIDLFNLLLLAGENGQEVSLQKTATHIQWRLGAGSWVDLVPLADIKGGDGDDGDYYEWRVFSGAVQRRLSLASPEAPWINTFYLEDLIGPAGEDAVMVANSNTGNLIGTGSKTFNYTTIPNLGLAEGQRVRAVSTLGNWMEGDIATVSPTSIVISVDLVSGAGTFSTWKIGIAGTPGVNGSSGGGAGSSKSRTSTIIKFDADHTVGSPENPITWQLPIDPNLIESGTRVLIYHSFPSVPTFLAAWTNTGPTSYLVGFQNLNLIEVTFHTSGLVTYFITAIANATFFTDKIPRRNLVLEALMTNIAPSVSPDTSFAPVAGSIVQNQQITVWHEDLVTGRSTPLLCKATSSARRSYVQYPLSAKLGLGIPFAISFYHRAGLVEDMISTGGIVMFSSHFYSGTGNLGVSGITTSETDLTYDIRINRNVTSPASTLRRLRVTGDPNFQASRAVFKHIFIWYDGTTFGMRINDQFQTTLATADVLAQNVTQSSPFFIGAAPTTLAATSVSGNSNFIRNFRVWSGYIPTAAEITALKNELNHLLS